MSRIASVTSAPAPAGFERSVRQPSRDYAGSSPGMAGLIGHLPRVRGQSDSANSDPDHPRTPSDDVHHADGQDKGWRHRSQDRREDISDGEADDVHGAGHVSVHRSVEEDARRRERRSQEHGSSGRVRSHGGSRDRSGASTPRSPHEYDARASRRKFQRHTDGSVSAGTGECVDCTVAFVCDADQEELTCRALKCNVSGSD